ncbi:MAG: hypothetical protein R3313_01055 [Candidatus Saccharimonadales bacterium]|nr:hypothetical protein [Candidatus Saccharimonadales bacterium]
MRLNQKGMVDLLFVVVLVVLVAAAAFTFWKISQTDETVSETQANTSADSSLSSVDQSKDEDTPSQSEQQDETQVDDSTVTEEGRFETAGYSFAIEEDWRVVIDSPGYGNIYNYQEDEAAGSERFPAGFFRLAFGIEKNDSTTSFEQYLDGVEYPDGKPTKVGDYDAVVYDGSGVFGPFRFYYVDLGSNDFLRLNPQGNYSEARVEELIASIRLED